MKRKLAAPKSIRSTALIAMLAVAVIFGVTMKLSSRAAGAVGDLNNDGTVNALDLSMMLTNWKKSGVGDINADGIVNIYDLSALLSNWGKTATPTPTPTPVPVVYCGGLTPCYGPADMAMHATNATCWGYNLTWVFDLAQFAPAHKNGSDNILTSSVCGQNIAGVLNGTVDSNGTHNHLSATKTNSSSSELSSYRVGYFDPNKP